MEDLPTSQSVRVLLTGDVMPGRGIDQILQHPNDPVLYEHWAKSSLRYVELAEQRNGPIPRGVPPEYIWGDALELMRSTEVDARIINLETAVTDHHEPWPGKGIHYRMHPDNVDTLTAARVDCCVLANNHVLDWSYPGLIQTLDRVDRAGLASAGAGLDSQSAAQPAMIETGSGARVVVIGVGATSSGIPRSWVAGRDRPGLSLLGSPADKRVNDIVETISAVSKPDDLVIVSVHWGPNWGYDIPASHRRFAHRLIDDAGVHVIHGHSAHHALGVEAYEGKLILYGCGDLINDYEGIGGYEGFRPDLRMVFVATLDPAKGVLNGLELIPMRMRRFRLERAAPAELHWVQRVLTRESVQLGVVFGRQDGRLRATFDRGADASEEPDE